MSYVPISFSLLVKNHPSLPPLSGKFQHLFNPSLINPGDVCQLKPGVQALHLHLHVPLHLMVPLYRLASSTHPAMEYSSIQAPS